MSQLQEMFDKQQQFQEKLGNLPLQDLDHHMDFLKEQAIALIDELMEAMREVPWKSWKKNQEYNVIEHNEEIIDMWHFLINISLAAGMESDDIHGMFMEKNKINNQRQEDNY